MSTALELLRQGRRDEIWSKYLGFLDLSLEETMQIQERLLLEQLQLLGTSELGRRILGGRVPATVEEFRASVPLTTYEDYADCLLERREDVLPRKPECWLHTSGRSGEYEYKWVPYTSQMVKRVQECTLGSLIMGACTRRGEFLFEEGDTMLFTLAPFPYLSGIVGRGCETEFNFTFMPPLEVAEKMEFAERVQEGFKLALKHGIDVFDGTASVLLRISEQFSHGAGGIKLSANLLHPQVLLRLIRALIRSRLAGRNYLLPRDLWSVKCIAIGGTDTALFRRQIEEHWGRSPVEGLGCTEGGIVAAQLWNRKGMTFIPDCNYLEFIPEDECMRSRSDPSFKPSTVTLAEVQAGHRYEIVLTNFMGGVLTRYRLGDMVEFISLRDDELNVDSPQMVFYSRVDDVIDLASFTRLTEKTIWAALESTGIAYTDWAARKEYQDEKVILHLYIETKNGDVDSSIVRDKVHKALLEADRFYADVQNLLGMDPLRVTLLSPGTFGRYILARQAEGADLGHLKPAHMNVSDSVVEKLLHASDGRSREA